MITRASPRSICRAARAIFRDGRRRMMRTTLNALLDAYRSVDDEQLWANLGYFLERVVPVAASAGVRLAIHPDDPPWSIFGLPRIITNAAALRAPHASRRQSGQRCDLLHRIARRRGANDLPAMIRSLGARGCISCTAATCDAPATSAFMRRRIRARTAMSTWRRCMRALRDVGFAGRCVPTTGE